MVSDVNAELQRVLGDEAVVLPCPFDARDDAQLDLAAGLLLGRFRAGDDVEAYVLLVELCQARLRQLAAGITRRLAVMVDPDDLVAGFMARLFTDVRPAADELQDAQRAPARRSSDRPVQRFLSLAYAMMRYDCLNQLRLMRRASARDARFELTLSGSREAPDPLALMAAREQGQALARLGTLLLLVVSRCFHALGLRDRRVLICREVEGQSYDEVAATLDLPRAQVGMILKRARERLALRLERALASPLPSTSVETSP